MTGVAQTPPMRRVMNLLCSKTRKRRAKVAHERARRGRKLPAIPRTEE